MKQSIGLTYNSLHREILTFFVAFVWLVNGLYCKILNLVPRHQEIVGHILGMEYAHTLTLLIGISEIIMAVWILLRIHPKYCAVFQIVIVITMNIIENMFVPDLLLWGRLNLIFAIAFTSIVWYNEFKLNNINN